MDDRGLDGRTKHRRLEFDEKTDHDLRDYIEEARRKLQIFPPGN